jgi:hypothetical protein
MVLKKKIEDIRVFHAGDKVEIVILSFGKLYVYTFSKYCLFADVVKMKEGAKLMFYNDIYLSDFQIKS